MSRQLQPGRKSSQCPRDLKLHTRFCSRTSSGLKSPTVNCKMYISFAHVKDKFRLFRLLALKTDKPGQPQLVGFCCSGTYVKQLGYARHLWQWGVECPVIIQLPIDFNSSTSRQPICKWNVQNKGVRTLVSWWIEQRLWCPTSSVECTQARNCREILVVACRVIYSLWTLFSAIIARCIVQQREEDVSIICDVPNRTTLRALPLHSLSLQQCFSTFVRPRPGKFFFYKTRALSQQVYS